MLKKNKFALGGGIPSSGSLVNYMELHKSRIPLSGRVTKLTSRLPFSFHHFSILEAKIVMLNLQFHNLVNTN